MSNARSLRYKIDELAAVFETNNTDVGCITETWLDANIPAEAVDKCIPVTDTIALTVVLVVASPAMSAHTGRAVDCKKWKRLTWKHYGCYSDDL